MRHGARLWLTLALAVVFGGCFGGGHHHAQKERPSGSPVSHAGGPGAGSAHHNATSKKTNAKKKRKRKKKKKTSSGLPGTVVRSALPGGNATAAGALPRLPVLIRPRSSGGGPPVPVGGRSSGSGRRQVGFVVAGVQGNGGDPGSAEGAAAPRPGSPETGPP